MRTAVSSSLSNRQFDRSFRNGDIRIDCAVEAVKTGCIAVAVRLHGLSEIITNGLDGGTAEARWRPGCRPTLLSYRVRLPSTVV